MTGWTTFRLVIFVVGCWPDTLSVPPSQKHQECHVKVIPQRLGMGTKRGMQLDGNAFFLHACLSHPSLAQARHRQGKARHDGTSLLCPCCCPALPRLPSAGVIPACLCPSQRSCCLRDLSETSSLGTQLSEERLKSRLHCCTGVW